VIGLPAETRVRNFLLLSIFGCCILDFGSNLRQGMNAKDTTAPPFETAEQYVYQQIRQEILSGDLPGGTPLNQDEVATRLRVSRTPVRQAFLRLGSDGFITNRPNYGSTVTSLGAQDILELFEIRSVLEGFAASLAVRKVDDRLCRVLRARAETLEQSHASPKRWLDMHNEFHDTLCVLADRPRLQKQVHSLRQRVVPYLRLYLSANKGAEIRGHEHLAIIDVLASRDPAAAEQAMRAHVMSAAKGVVEFVANQEILANQQREARQRERAPAGKRQKQMT